MCGREEKGSGGNWGRDAVTFPYLAGEGVEGREK